MKNLSVFSEKQVETFANVASELKVKTEKRTVEKWLNELYGVLKDKTRKELTKQQIAVLNTLQENERAEQRALRIQDYSPSKPGICEVIKIEACKATEKNPADVNSIAEQLSKQFNRDLKKMQQRVKSQFSYYLKKEHGILMEKKDATHWFCKNPEYAKTKVK